MSTQLETLAAKLAARTPSTRGRISTCFLECADLLEDRFKCKIPVKDVLDDFNEVYGLNVSIASFRKLLQEHRKRGRTNDAISHGQREVMA